MSNLSDRGLCNPYLLARGGLSSRLLLGAAMIAGLDSWCSGSTDVLLSLFCIVSCCSWKLSTEPHSQYPVNKLHFLQFFRNQLLLLTTKNLNSISSQLTRWSISLGARLNLACLYFRDRKGRKQGLGLRNLKNGNVFRTRPRTIGLSMRSDAWIQGKGLSSLWERQLQHEVTVDIKVRKVSGIC